MFLSLSGLIVDLKSQIIVVNLNFSIDLDPSILSCVLELCGVETASWTK